MAELLGRTRPLIQEGESGHVLLSKGRERAVNPGGPAASELISLVFLLPPFRCFTVRLLTEPLVEPRAMQQHQWILLSLEGAGLSET